ncbi:carbohydrate ABC transporter permease [Dictyobacter formicarum]|uniref:Sugar ABC transporter permease n=1 Tax=Dictyobacter formicarum TaxID=2778368 RepID=A0ABQ3VIW2_9CHLR|nr:sugar ABC transporter permease [Dictyobacter formicarum]GHO86144.1 sugar ABC transporter permease [Dictyobacter formicarum]
MNASSSVSVHEATGKPQNIQPGTRKQMRKRERRTTLAYWSMVGPLILGLTVFTFLPIVWSIVLSFFNARSTILPTQFIGFDNYLNLLNDDSFRKAMVTGVLFALFIIPTTCAFALGLALLVNSVRYGRGFFRSVFFIPTACSYVVASLIWKMGIFNGLQSGLMNTLLAVFGVERISTWLTSPNPPLFWIVLVTCRLWLQLGFYMILFIAGLQDIPRELYEAAEVDGAKRGWPTFRYITLPLLRNTTVAVLILNLIAAFQAYDEFYNILGSFTGSSGNIVLGRPPLLYLYQIAIGGGDFGRGSAGAIIIALTIMIFTLLQSKFLSFGKAN